MLIKTLLTAAAIFTISTDARADAGSNGDWEMYDFEGSQVAIEYKYQDIRFVFPDGRWRGLVDQGQVAFVGKIERHGKAEGDAYAYKRGCDFVPYPVSGHYDKSVPGFVMTGPAPIWKGCKVIGFTKKQDAARLVFVDVETKYQSPQKVTKNVDRSDEYYDEEGDPNWQKGFIDNQFDPQTKRHK